MNFVTLSRYPKTYHICLFQRSGSQMIIKNHVSYETIYTPKLIQRLKIVRCSVSSFLIQPRSHHLFHTVLLPTPNRHTRSHRKSIFPFLTPPTHSYSFLPFIIPSILYISVEKVFQRSQVLFPFP